IKDEGRLTDAQGRTIDFRNTIIIMTSNIGYRGFGKELQEAGLGFRREEGEEARERAVFRDMERKMVRLFEERFTPEFRNRIDEVVVFQPLQREHVLKIVDIELQPFLAELEHKNITLELTNAARERIADLGFDKYHGARPLRRTLQTYVIDPLSERILLGEIGEGDRVIVDVEDDRITIRSAVRELVGVN
ncbi:MAG TPA: ATP-dependent Clp protease ATP-binding subunit, partial [Armatimonadetes bacterium]|nr:ATP-dependent Clp protease ATP-binding subunit [Armatimonadota bacterium]